MADMLGTPNGEPAPNAALHVPEPHEVIEVLTDDGSRIAVRRHGAPDGPRMVLSHGNGLAADLYYPFWSLLEDHFDLVIYDFRNHGWNPSGDLRKHNVHQFVNDNQCVFELIDRRFGSKPKIGVFHSLSALTALLQSLRGEDFSALVLFDPPLCSPGISIEDHDAALIFAGKVIRQRASRFESREQFVELLSYSRTYGRMDLAMRNLIAMTTLRRTSTGSGFELRCPPPYEAQAVEHISAWAVMVDFGAISCPTKIIGADPTLSHSFLPTFDLSEITDTDYDFIPDASHFLQLEQPKQCVDMMLNFLVSNGVLDSPELTRER